MSTDSEVDSELLALRNELLQGLKSKKSPNKNQNLIVESNNDDEELEQLRLQALEAKKLAKNTHNLDDKKTKLPGRFRYDRESEEEDDDEEFEIEIYSNKKRYQSDQENEGLDDQKIKSDDFLDKYQKYRDRCTRIMSNEAYEPGLITSNLKETLNNLDLKRLLNENGEEIEPESKYAKTDLILEQLDYAYRPITEPICIKRNEVYINTNFRQKIRYQRNTFRNGETRYWKNNNNYIKLKQNEDKTKNLDDAYDEDLEHSNFEDDDDDDEDFQKNKKLKSIVQQVVKTNNKRDDSNLSSNDRHHYSNYKRRRRYYSSSSR